MVKPYHLFNGIAVTSLLTRLHEMVSLEQMQDFSEDLALEDEAQQGAISWKVIMEAWRINKLPRLDEELMEFLFYLAMRNSETS